MKNFFKKIWKKIYSLINFVINHWKRFLISLIILVIFLLTIPFLAFNYYSGWGKVFRPMLRVIPYPMVRIGDKDKVSINSREILTNLEAVRGFYLAQNFEEVGLRVDFKTKEGKQRLEIRELDVLNRIVENRMIELISKKRGHQVVDTDLELFLLERLDSPEKDKIFFSNIRNLYGWTRNDFKNIVVKYEVYRNKLIEDFSREARGGEPYKKINQYSKELFENPNKFDEFARNYSDGETAQEGGSVGWFTDKQILDDLQRNIKDMKKGAISDVLISELGYHIIRIDDIRIINNDNDNDKNSYNEYKLSQIFIKDDDFFNWLRKQKRQIPVKVYPRKYQWDKEKAKLVFRDSDMRALMLKIKTKSSGDPSIN